MEHISIEDFAKLDIRICKIVMAEKIEGADKLLKITLDEGDGQTRVIVSGIALAHPEPETIIGKMVPVIVNLAPRAMKGVTSNGMMLCPQNAEGLPVLLSPISEVTPGAKVR